VYGDYLYKPYTANNRLFMLINESKKWCLLEIGQEIRDDKRCNAH